MDKSIDPVQLVHSLCAEAKANPEKKKGRWVKRMTPVTSIRKTLSVDLESFAKEILKPHFHAGGPPKKVSPTSPPSQPASYAAVEGYEVALCCDGFFLVAELIR